MSPDSRLKARVKFLKGQLSVGQTLYFAPWDAYEMKEDEIRLEPVQIKHIPESGGAVKVLRANGQTCSFGINRNGRVEFHWQPLRLGYTRSTTERDLIFLAVWR